MRLLQNTPLLQLNDLNLAQGSRGLARNFISVGEHIKVSEQKLNFLLRCKKRRIFPSFIHNSLNITRLFPDKTTGAEFHVNLLRKMSLNQHIEHHFSEIACQKLKFREFKDSLFATVQRDNFYRILAIAKCYMTHIKEMYKGKLKKKFEWLLQKSRPTHSPFSNVPPVPFQKPDERITLINCDSLSDTQKQVLSLGPNFAITPKLDEKFKEKVSLDIAQCVFKLRHRLAIEQRENSCSEENGGNVPESDTVETQEEEELPFKRAKRKCPFPTPFTRTPDPVSPLLEDKLATFNRFVMDLLDATKPESNLTLSQKAALVSLQKNKDIHISVSDKCGEFVVCSALTHKQLTEKHLEETPVYKRVLPHRKIGGVLVPIQSPTTQQCERLIKKKTADLVVSSNKLWKDLVKDRSLDDEYCRLIRTPEAVSLPVLYVLIKTHKNSPESFRSSIPIEQLKVRPIISCVDSPTERLSWLVTDILRPLLKEIPTHLSNLCQHLEELRKIPQDQLMGRKIFTADIAALYTNVNVQGSIDDIIELANEYSDRLDMLGLNLTDVHKILTHILTNSYFMYNGQLWLQVDGLFMGLRPGPLLAVVRVYTFEKRSIFVDLNYISVYLRNFFKRYIDDATSTANTKEEAGQILQRIAEQDPDSKLKWELDFPEKEGDFVPFLNTEVRIEGDGSITSRLFRKPQQKDITLHHKSHHPDSVKTNTILNMYREAENISSDGEQREYSFDILDNLLFQNGYSNTRQTYMNARNKNKRKKTDETDNRTLLRLDFISDSICNKIRNFIKCNKLPIKVNFGPGTKLRNLLCANRPYDKRKCIVTNCKVCPNITTRNKDCEVKNVVYRITCKLCHMTYIGETSRSAHERLGEHLRYATNPHTRSNAEQAFALHYKNHHVNCPPQLQFELLRTERDTVRRKIWEAMLIVREKPVINTKEELDTIKRFLINNNQ